MMSRKEILRRLESNDPNEQIVISPLLDPETQIQQGGIDLRLGNVFIVSKRARLSTIDPAEYARKAVSMEMHQELVHVPLGESLALHPGETVLGATIEYVVLPGDTIGTIGGRSSWGRHGLIVATAVKISPGCKSSITLELINNSSLPLKLYPGLRIAHLSLYELPEGQSQGSVYNIAIGPEFSKLHLDPELRYLSGPSLSNIVVIGISGRINSGKSRVARILNEKLNFAVRSISQALSGEITRKHEYLYSPEERYDFKLRLRRQYGNHYFATVALKSALGDYPKGVIIDGINHPDEIRYLRGCSNFHFVVTGADTDWRYRQFQAWNSDIDVSRDYFERIDQRTFEGLNLNLDKDSCADNISECMSEQHDFIRCDNKDVDARIQEFLDSLRD